jgi:hypothetical protein
MTMHSRPTTLREDLEAMIAALRAQSPVERADDVADMEARLIAAAQEAAR